ncbi:hypothetical protein GCM10009564_00470 [Streptomyces thermogriseus]|uniref:Uncharacterized protein n=1 Tax=Streptomyces thermogriseus TaxID=75292 RepID=A0ABN1SR27_9ACTN
MSRAGADVPRTAPPRARLPPVRPAAGGSSSGCGLACSGMPSMPPAVRRGTDGPPGAVPPGLLAPSVRADVPPSVGSSRVPCSSSRTGPSPFLTPARVPRRAVCKG